MGATELETQALEALRRVIDPEVGINIVDLGLIYGVQQTPEALMLRITMTSAACPMTEAILDDVDAALAPLLPAPLELDIELVFDPPWSPALMSPVAKAQLGWMQP